MPRPPVLFGLMRHREVPLPTWRGWFLIVAILIPVVLCLPPALYHWLAVSDPAGTGLLVVEGWVPDHAVARTADLYNTGTYTRLVTTGVRIETGFFLSDFGTTAEVAAATLRRMGIDSTAVTPIPAADTVARDRTAASARALQRWLTQVSPAPDTIDIVTLGVHARRTRMVFQRVLGDSIRVGVIAVPDPRYDASGWWRASAGVKDVLSEVVGTCFTLIGSEAGAREKSP